MRVKIDLHIHTNCSHDSLITLRELTFYVKRRKLDGVAVTDHDKVEGALKAVREADILTIPGIEVSSLDGHIIGLNVREPIPPRLSAEETVDRIHELGGLAIACPACHPKVIVKLRKLTGLKFDAVEVINSSAFPFKCSLRLGQELASRLKVARVAGSDAHYGPEIGLAYTLVNAELEADEVVKAIGKGLCEPFGEATPLRIRLKRELLLLKRRFITPPL